MATNTVKRRAKRKTKTYTCQRCGKQVETSMPAKWCGEICRVMASQERARAKVLARLGVDIKVEDKPDGKGQYVWLSIPDDAMVIINVAAARDGLESGPWLKGYLDNVIMRARAKNG